ncbi:MAG: DUF488 domain-containing protein [Methanobacterium sp.]
MIKIKRIYEIANEDDGFRILVDKLWPRGVSKEKAKLNMWMKEVAPSDELRKWFSHDPDKWKEFKRIYENELNEKTELLEKIKDIERKNKVITLVYSAKNEEYNNAVVLGHVLNEL